MLKARLWRIATAAVAVSALLMTAAGGATAQTDPIEDLLDPGQLDQLGDLLGGDGGENGVTGTPLDAILDALDLEELDELLGLLDGLPGDNGDNGDNGDAPEPQTEEGDTVEDGDVPGTDIGGFVGTANATAMEISVGLPEALRDGLAPVLEALGIDGGEGIHIKLGETQAQLERAAEGEEVDGLAEALVTNLLLDSEALDSPGSCTGGPTDVELPPDAEVPLLTVSVLGVDCELDDERALADVQIAGVNLSLAGLIDAGVPEDVRGGLDAVLDPINEELLGALNDAVICGVLDEALGELLPGSDACEALSLELQNPLDVDVPVVDIDLLGSTSEVTATDDEVTADAEAGLAGVNLLGLVCVGSADDAPLTYSASVATDGESANEPEVANPSATVGLCGQDENILNLVSDLAPLQLIEVLGEDVHNLLDGTLEPVFEGLEELMDAINTSVVSDGEAYTNVEGAGAVAGVTPLTILGTAPLADLPGLGDVLGDLSVSISSMEVEAAVNAEPEEPGPTPAGPDPDPAPEPEPDEEDLPVTGASAALFGLGALGLAVAMRRRDDED